MYVVGIHCIIARFSLANAQKPTTIENQNNADRFTGKRINIAIFERPTTNTEYHI